MSVSVVPRFTLFLKMYLLRNSCIKYFLAVSMFAKLKTCSKGSSVSLCHRRALHYLNLKCPTNFNSICIYFARGKKFITETSNPSSVFSEQKARVNLQKHHFFCKILPRKSHLHESRLQNFPGGSCPWTPLVGLTPFGSSPPPQNNDPGYATVHKESSHVCGIALQQHSILGGVNKEYLTT